MSDSYYRVDAVRPDGQAGDAVFVRAANKEGALEAVALERPDVAEWNLTANRIKREDFPVTEPTEVIVLPPIQEVIPGVDPENVTDDEDRQWNEFCTNLILTRLREKRAAGDPRPELLTQYPLDTIEEGNDSRDLVTLDRHDTVAVIDTGVR